MFLHLSIRDRLKSQMWPRLMINLVLFTGFLILAFPVFAQAQTKRVVVVQYDGLPYEVVDRFVRERNPRTGKSQLPWVDHVFYQRGTRLSNFYVRGMSLSAPSWSLLNTGQHLQIKGNVEFDRNTLQTYDYLNFIPFYVNATIGARVDMQGAEVLDSIGIPILLDAFPRRERHVSFSLFQRGVKYQTFRKALENTFRREPRELFDEWTIGLKLRDAVPEQLVRELIQAIAEPRYRYLEISLTEFDHVGHHNNDRDSHLRALKDFDRILGELWTAIQKTPQAQETALIVVSDHGTNSVEGVYSQGYNLVKLLGSGDGGGHHVITKRRLLADYAIKSLNPFIQEITTTSRDSFYLKGDSENYPTAMVDFDGNERASIHLRDSDLNLLQILLQQLQQQKLSPELKKAATDRFFKTLDSRRSDWQQKLADIDEELTALRRGIETQRQLCASQPKKFNPSELEDGKDEEGRRVCAQLYRWIGQERGYSKYAQTLRSFLSLKPETFDASKLKLREVIAPRMMGDRNNVHQLQNYIVGLSPKGLVLNADGSLNLAQSFIRTDYFRLLHSITVKNNVQPAVGNRPIDIIAVRVSSELVAPALGEKDVAPDVIWLYGDHDHQALILSRQDQDGELSFRFVPIKNLREDESGQIHFEQLSWQPGIPLKIFEDPNFSIPQAGRAAWLNQWHREIEWLHALHKTRYSNGLVGVYEELARHRVGKLNLEESNLSADEKLMRRLLKRRREAIETDLLVIANNHWNFDVRGFNPGGNHGSFFRISTHSTFMLAGGERTGIPHAAVVDEPYDSLSFVPTVLALTGNLRDDNQPSQILWDKGFRRFPGRVVKEVLANPQTSATGATASP